MTILISIITCMILYSIKGGWHGMIRRKIARLAGIEFNDGGDPVGSSTAQSALWSLMDGKILSTIGFIALTFYLTDSPLLSVLGGTSWLIGVSPSMGEEVGAVGGYRGGWGPYIDRGFGRSYGVKKCLQRGVFTTALMTTLFPATLAAGVLMPAAYYAGISIEQSQNESVNADWHWAEPIFGAIIGLAVGLSHLFKLTFL